MSSGVILAGLGLAAVGFGGRYIARTMPQMAQKMEVHLERKTICFCVLQSRCFQAATKDFKMPKLDAAAWENSKYHKGGFDPKMTKREAALILGVSPNANVKKVNKDLRPQTSRGSKVFYSDPRRPQESDDPKPSGPRGQPLPCGQNQRGQGLPGQIISTMISFANSQLHIHYSCRLYSLLS